MPLNFEIRKISQLILFIFVLILIVYIISQIAILSSSNENLQKVARIFDLDGEGNIPTYFSTMLFLISSILLFLISKIELNQNSKFWLVLSFIFLFLSIEDFIQLHERFTNVVFLKFHTGGALRFIWIYPAFLTVILAFFYFRKFFFNLPRKTRINFIIAAILFFTGTFILELIGGIILSSHGEIKSQLFLLFTAIEESLENLGVWFFIHTLLYYLSSLNPNIEIHLAKPQR